MSINEGLEPGAGLLVANLEGVCEDGRVIILGEVLELRLGEVVCIVCAAKLLLCSSNGILDADGRRGGRDLGGLDERRPEGGDLVGLVEGDVRDRVGDWDTVQPLLDVDVARGLAIEGRADVNGIGVDAAARLDEGNGRVFEGRVRALGQRVVNTIPEGLYNQRSLVTNVKHPYYATTDLVGRRGVVRLDLEIPNLASPVGCVLRVDGVRNRGRGVRAEHRKENRGQDLLESEHDSSKGE